MPTPYEIPLTPNAQTFDVSLGGIDYNMRLIWNSISACWVLDIADASNNPLVRGIPLVTGANLLGQYAYLGIPGGLTVTVDDGIGVPTYPGLGSTGHLYFVTLP